MNSLVEPKCASPEFAKGWPVVYQRPSYDFAFPEVRARGCSVISVPLVGDVSLQWARVAEETSPQHLGVYLRVSLRHRAEVSEFSCHVLDGEPYTDDAVREAFSNVILHAAGLLKGTE